MNQGILKAEINKLEKKKWRNDRYFKNWFFEETHRKRKLLEAC